MKGKIMADLTTNPVDPRLGRGTDVEPGPQNDAYLIMEGTSPFVRPVRRTYVHSTCGAVTTMSQAIAETYARAPKFYGSTYCVGCQKHLPVVEFHWDGTTAIVGS